MTHHHDQEMRIQLLDQAKLNFLGDNRIANTWRMSNAGYAGQEGYCRRRRVLQYYGIPETLVKEEKEIQDGIFLRGHLTERSFFNDVLHPAFPRMIAHPYDHDSLIMTLSLDPKIVMSGRPDFLLPPSTIHECKSINADAILEGPKESHVCQVTLYMYALQLRLGLVATSVNRCWIHYVREGRQYDVWSYQIVRDEALINKLVEETMDLHCEYVEKFNGQRPVFAESENLNDCNFTFDESKLPLRMPDPDKYPCMWHSRKYAMHCGYFQDCWHDYGEIRKQKEATKAKKPTKRKGKVKTPTADGLEESRDLHDNK